jgi:hypothetical protein
MEMQHLPILRNDDNKDKAFMKVNLKYMYISKLNHSRYANTSEEILLQTGFDCKVC